MLICLCGFGFFVLTGRYSRCDGHSGGIFDWIQTGLLPRIFPKQQWYNGDFFTDFEKDYFLEYNKVVGGVKLTQRRVDPQLCEKSESELVDWFTEHYYDPIVEGNSNAKCSAHFDEYYPVLFPNLDMRYCQTACPCACHLADGPPDSVSYPWAAMPRRSSAVALTQVS